MLGYTLAHFPRRNAGASLKPRDLPDGMRPGRDFPRRNAGASLKPAVNSAGVGTATGTFPGEMPGPH